MKRLFKDKFTFVKKILPYFGILLFIFLLYKVGINKILLTSRDIDKSVFFVLPLTISSILCLQTLKWQVILSQQRQRVSFKELFKIILIGIFYGIITPARVGAFVKVTYLKDRAKIPLVAASASAVLDKFLDVIALFTLALIGTYLLIDEFQTLFILIASILIFLIISFLFFYKRRRAESFIKGLIGPFIPDKLKATLRNSFETFFASLPKKRRHLGLPVILTFMSWVIIYSQSYIIAVSLGIKIDYFIFIFLFPIGTFVGLLPITISGIGTREATLVSLFLLFNIAPAKIVSLSIINLIICGYLPAFLGWLLIFKESHKIINNLDE